uniref:Homeobox domain-containing protein n=1 Tax=Oryctolagus cuniculus TaxID=9986 RepID=G1TQH6_RABIT
MDLNSTISGTPQKEAFQGRIAYTENQKGILLAWFEQNPNPNKASRELLAKEIGIPASKIQTWFKNQRRKQKQLENQCSQGEDQIQGSQECLLKKAREDQFPITEAQRRILAQAFERDRFPDINTMKKLAKRVGIRASRIQMWFQKERALCSLQNRRELMNFPESEANGQPALIVQHSPSRLSTLPDGTHHFPSSGFFSSTQTVLPVLPAPWDPFSVCVSQRSSVVTTQVTQAGQGQNSDPTVTLPNHLPVLLPLEEDFSDTQVPFTLEECPDHKEHAGTGLPLSYLPQPELQEQHSQADLAHTQAQADLAYVLQHWEESCQALIAEWRPLEGTC